MRSDRYITKIKVPNKALKNRNFGLFEISIVYVYIRETYVESA